MTAEDELNLPVSVVSSSQQWYLYLKSLELTLLSSNAGAKVYTFTYKLFTQQNQYPTLKR